eukprot:5623967-Pyramimonas_sp.AAC.1
MMGRRRARARARARRLRRDWRAQRSLWRRWRRRWRTGGSPPGGRALSLLRRAAVAQGNGRGACSVFLKNMIVDFFVEFRQGVISRKSRVGASLPGSASGGRGRPRRVKVT